MCSKHSLAYSVTERTSAKFELRIWQNSYLCCCAITRPDIIRREPVCNMVEEKENDKWTETTMDGKSNASLLRSDESRWGRGGGSIERLADRRRRELSGGQHKIRENRIRGQRCRHDTLTAILDTWRL